ncbi:MAG: DUF4280 domain-containing protein [Burkholderiaceae bacterium]
MPNHVCNGATLQCSMGALPSKLLVLPVKLVNTGNQPAANIMDHVQMVNIMPFGPCMSQLNPATAAATAAALGSPTPGPCMPNTPMPWVSGSPTVVLANFPALNKSSTLTCMAGGAITITVEGQTAHQIP